MLVCSAAMGYIAVRRAADIDHWGQYISIICVLALAGVAIPTSRQHTAAGYVAREVRDSGSNLTLAEENVFAAIRQNFLALRQNRQRSGEQK